MAPYTIPQRPLCTNVKNVPPSTLHMWLERVGFTDVKLVDINQTTVEEQRTTHWMPYQSLSDFLDPSNSNLTIEGYPAPKRAFFTAKRA